MWRWINGQRHIPLNLRFAEKIGLTMKTCAIDIHHHYVPNSLLEEAKKHGRHLGVDLIEKDGQK